MKTKILLVLFALPGIVVLSFAQPQLSTELFASGFDSPLGIVNAGDDRLFVIEQRGHVQILNADGVVLETPFLDLTDVVSQSGFETGLLGLAFHPDYNDNGYLYVNYTRNTDGHTVVSRFTTDPGNPDQVSRDSEVQLLTVEQPYANHNGGQLLFGPDGYLYVFLGDGGDAGDPHNNGQDLTVLLGKILRIDVNVGNDSSYAIPAGNPFVDDEAVRGEIWAYGLRNPWRNTFDRVTGDLWIADVGQNAFEEINFQPAGSSGGGNYGWRCYEGNAPYNTEDCEDEGNYIFPVYEYPHEGEGCSGSVTGGHVYRGALYEGMYGVYVFADFCTGNVYTAEQTNGSFEGAPAGNFGPGEVTSFGEDQYGELYVVMQSSGEIRRLTETGNCNPVAVIHAEDSALVAENDSSLLLQAAFHPSLEYQWFVNDEPLQGEVEHQLEVTAPGSYAVQVTNPSNGCTSTSEALEITSGATSVAVNTFQEVRVYPNPARNELFIEGLPMNGKLQINLFDAGGAMHLVKHLRNQGMISLPVSDYTPGVYYLQLVYGNGILHKKIIIGGN